ncbi:MAG TPA: hypothetical protein DEB46_01965 [Myxococcales bacterium]|nr:hypothetical protein [Myxococcales bacterium]
MSLADHEHSAERLSDASDWALAQRLWTFMKPHRVQFFSALSLYLPITIAVIAEPWVIGTAIDRYMKSTSPVGERLLGITDLALLGIGLVLFCGVCLVGQQLLMQRFGQNTLLDLRRAGFKKVMRLEMGVFDREPVGRLMARLTNDIEALSEVFAFGAVGMVADLIMLGTMTLWLFYLDASLAGWAMLVVPPVIVTLFIFQRFAHNTYGALRRRSSAMNAYFQEALNGLSTVQLFGAEQAIGQRYDRANAEYREAAFKTIRYDVTLYAVIEAAGTLSTALILWHGAGQISGPQAVVTLGLLIAFTEYMQRFFQPLRDLGSKYALLQAAFAAADRVFGLIDTTEEPADRHDAKELRGPISSIGFENVVFNYVPDEPVLRGVNLRIERGERIAIVGRTGSGKTTLLALLCRFRRPDSGRVLIGHDDLADLNISSFRRRLGVVQQDTYLFAGTLEENVTMNATQPDLDRIDYAFKMCSLDAVRRRLGHRVQGESDPVEVETEILDAGTNLSAGERQLVAMARALYRDPEILLLDEATASIDQETERLLQTATEKVLDGRTSLVVAHRLSTVETADRIIVLSEGQIIEQGSPSDLLSNPDGHFAQMVAAQRRKEAVAIDRA